MTPILCALQQAICDIETYFFILAKHLDRAYIGEVLFHLYTFFPIYSQSRSPGLYPWANLRCWWMDYSLETGEKNMVL